MANGALNRAKSVRKDEFYTKYGDIEQELKYYKQHFKGKTVYLNCDNPEVSNFWRYFIDHFKELGIIRLMATYLNHDEKSWVYETLDGEEVHKKRLEDNGDFREEESVKILKQSDIIVTNPPFSLWRPYIHQLINHNKKFLILGRQTATGYRDIFPYILNKQLWTGVHTNKVMQFQVPEDYDLIEGKYETYNNKYYIKVPAISWYTNLTHAYQYKDRRLTSTYKNNEEEYPMYENYPAININRLANIPKDYDGEMGVPITILNNFNFNQFQITGFRKGLDEKDLTLNGKKLYTRVLIKKI